MSHAASSSEPPRSGANNAASVPSVDIARLKQYPFLARCSEIVLKKLQPNLTEQRFEPGQTILRMGSYTDAAYYVAEGVVTVRMSPVDGRPNGPAAAPLPPAAPLTDRIRSILGRK